MTVALRQLINSLNLTGDPSEIAAVLNAKSVRVAVSEKLTDRELRARLGSALVERLDGALRSLGWEWLRRLLATTGVDFSHEEILAAVEDLVAKAVLTVADAMALIGLGERWLSPYEQISGAGQSVTVEAVAEALIPPTVDGERRLFSLIVEPDGRTVGTLMAQPTAGGESCGPARTRQFTGSAAEPLRQFVLGLAIE